MNQALSDTALYKSDKQFSLADFFVSHSQLLLRSLKIKTKHGLNIDIIFFGVAYVQLPSWLEGVSITQNTSGKRFDSKRIDKFLDEKSRKLFEIQSRGDSYYIVAADFVVFENDLELKETSLGVAEPKGREKEIARSF